METGRLKKHMLIDTGDKAHRCDDRKNKFKVIQLSG